MFSSPEPQPRALLGLLGLDLAVARRGMGMQRNQQAPGRIGNFRDRAVEGCLVGLRRLVEAGKFPHELQRGGVDFILGRGRLEIEQRLDVTAHLSSPWPGARALKGWFHRGHSAAAKSYITVYSVIEWAAPSPLSPRPRHQKKRVPNEPRDLQDRPA